MKNPNLWNREDLHQHLQHAIDLELWTIPLYLTALYSIKGIHLAKHQDYPEAGKLIFSVVVQEMLHLELVSNIANALGYKPKFPRPIYNEAKGIPFIHPHKNYLPKELTGYSVKAQALNVNSLKLFCAIELPHPKKELEWVKEKSYDSIAELYEALKIGISAHWDTYYIGDKANTKQKNSFNEYHNQNGKHHGFSQTIYSLDDANKAIDAIIEQGEGADSHKVPADFRPPTTIEGQEYDTAWHKGHLSHFQKFRILLHAHHKLPEVYPIIEKPQSEIQQLELHTNFNLFLKEMELFFNHSGEEFENSFWKSMFSISASITAVWECGDCPKF